MGQLDPRLVTHNGRGGEYIALGVSRNKTDDNGEPMVVYLALKDGQLFHRTPDNMKERFSPLDDSVVPLFKVCLASREKYEKITGMTIEKMLEEIFGVKIEGCGNCPACANRREQQENGIGTDPLGEVYSTENLWPIQR